MLRRNETNIRDRSGGKEKPPGKPRRRWMDCIKQDLAEKGLEVQAVAKRLLWKSMTSNSDPT